MHNICCDNCHSHCARALNNFKYRGKEDWTMISVWWLIMTEGKYVSTKHILYTYGGFVVILTLCILLKFAF